MKNLYYILFIVGYLLIASSIYTQNGFLNDKSNNEEFLLKKITDASQSLFEMDSCDYCEASGGGEEYIDGVEIGTIVNLGNGYQSYSDYTNLSTEVTPGMTYTMIVYTENVFFDDDYGVWIDWNQDCEFDINTENAICEVNNGQDIHYFDIEVPTNAAPGLTTMRIRLKFAGNDCGIPCDSTLWGEVEDYSLYVSNPGYAILEGYITNCLNGDPVEGAEVQVWDLYSFLSGEDGFYSSGEILNGLAEISCFAQGYCPFDTTLTLYNGQIVNLDIELCPAQFETSEDTIYISLYPDEISNTYFTLSNTGNCDIDYYAGADVGWLGGSYTISGVLTTGEALEIGWPIGTDNLLPGSYEGNIIFESNAISSPDSIHVMLEVLINAPPPINLSFSLECTDICLEWEMPSGGNPLYFNIYRDGVLLTDFSGVDFCDENLIPETEYSYQVTAVYETGESEPTFPLYITVPTPAPLEPYDLEAIIHYPDELDVTLIWEEPTSCLLPDGYNIYRNEIQINDSLIQELTYIDFSVIPDYYGYHVTAVYYFGESDPSNWVEALLYSVDEISIDSYKIFPNPARNLLNFQSDFKIDELSIYNIHGQYIMHIAAKQNEIQIDVSQFEPGIYFIELEIGDKTALSKIVVE